MTDNIFIDSNIFLYTLDVGEPERREKAKVVLLNIGETERVTISTQVLNEIYAVATKKLQVDPLYVKEFIRGLYDFDIIHITPQIIESAIDCSILHRLNYWDALMVASAETARCSILLTEDMRSGSTIRGVEIRNPFG